MRTTLTIEDSVAQLLKDRAHASGKSFKAIVNETLRLGLQAGESTPSAIASYSVPQVAMGIPKMDLVSANRLASQLEDDSLLRKLEVRK